MAIEQSGFRFTAIAGEDMTGKQYRWVKMSADMTVIGTAAVTDIMCGILQNNPFTGAAADVMVAGISKIVGGGTLVAGNIVSTDANGRAIAIVSGTDTTKYIGGTVIMGCGNLETGSVLVDCSAPARAA